LVGGPVTRNRGENFFGENIVFYRERRLPLGFGGTLLDTKRLGLGPVPMGGNVFLLCPFLGGNPRVAVGFQKPPPHPPKETRKTKKKFTPPPGLEDTEVVGFASLAGFVMCGPPFFPPPAGDFVSQKVSGGRGGRKRGKKKTRGFLQKALVVFRKRFLKIVQKGPLGLGLLENGGGPPGQGISVAPQGGGGGPKGKPFRGTKRGGGAKNFFFFSEKLFFFLARGACKQQKQPKKKKKTGKFGFV